MALLNYRGQIIERTRPVLALPRPELVRPLRTVEREAVESALILCEGNRRLTAKRLGVAYRTLLRWVEEFRNEDMDAANLA
jgi:hypothetical protein